MATVYQMAVSGSTKGSNCNSSKEYSVRVSNSISRRTHEALVRINGTGNVYKGATFCHTTPVSPQSNVSSFFVQPGGRGSFSHNTKLEIGRSPYGSVGIPIHSIETATDPGTGADLLSSIMKPLDRSGCRCYTIHSIETAQTPEHRCICYTTLYYRNRTDPGAQVQMLHYPIVL
ncbi:hypothetical protein AVEN_274754-1 [Araneus ventricosus]|uniref:Uncharacterized protein n=1 Tax=Araneus ventricosus TaxID=182803 RepID=A0A4Y2S0R1_ARAVE|nr:hypothetical protein AVEN_274754-1 [Araneus ventricosus]